MLKTPEETSMTDDWAQFHQQELEKQKVGLSTEYNTTPNPPPYIAKWVARLLATAALRVRIQTSLNNTKMGDISKKK
jgi:hypothetical protein